MALSIFTASRFSSTPKYTSEDLALLPCEDPEDRFFYPLEFDEAGKMVYEDQFKKVEQALCNPALTDVFVFIHGWDKTSQTAEWDYQDFVCRLRKFSHSKVDQLQDQQKSIMVGVFWPSTCWPNNGDPLVLKPMTYFIIRERASRIGRNGLGGALVRLFAMFSANTAPNKRFHFIGHSFGAKMILQAIQSYLESTPRLAWFAFAKEVNFVLLLPAVPQGDLRLALSSRSTKITQKYTEDQIKAWLGKAKVYVVHSHNDGPNGWLLPLGEWRIGEWRRSIGAVGERVGKRFITDGNEYILKEPYDSLPPRIFNIDASKFIFGHGDIYKGRVTKLVWDCLRSSGQLDLIKP